MSNKADEEKAALKSQRELKEASLEFKAEANEKLKNHNKHAENGPDGAQRGQALPAEVKIKADAEPTSKPQVTQK